MFIALTLIYVDVIVIVTNVIVTLLSTLNKFFLLLLFSDNRDNTLFSDPHDNTI